MNSPQDLADGTSASNSLIGIDPRLEKVIEDYLNRLQSGEAVDRQEIVAIYPDLAPALGRQLAFFDTVYALSRQELRESYSVATVHSHVSGYSTDPLGKQRDCKISCPQCGNAIALATRDSVEITCRQCGSNFNICLETSVRLPPLPLPEIGGFEVLEILGRGAFGVVFKARDRVLNRIVAIKVPRCGQFLTDEEQKRFLREARHAAQLRHPGIVTIYAIAEEKGVPYIVAEYIDGITLADMMSGRILAFRDTAELIAEVADAIDYAHQQKVIHRDLKPSNILIDAYREPHVTDFGLARRDDAEATMTLDGEVIGTPAYMSPEQARGEHNLISPRSDVYSLGVVLYRLFTGELPFRGSRRMLIHQVLNDEPRPLRSINDTIPRDLETITLKAMAKEPSRRYESARELAADLRRWGRGEPIVARPTRRLEQIVRWSTRNRLDAGLIAAVSLLLLLVAFGGFSSAIRERRLRANADDARRNEGRERYRADRNAAESRVNWLRLMRRNGINELENDDPHMGLLWFAAAMAADPADVNRDRVNRVRMGTILRHSPHLVQLWAPRDLVKFIHILPDGDSIICVYQDGEVVLWNAVTGSASRIVMHHGEEISAVAVSDNRHCLATAGFDGMVHLWCLSTGQRVTLREKHQDTIRALAFSRDGEYVATGSDDLTARVWYSDTGEPACTPMVHDQMIRRLTFRPDGQRLATAAGIVNNKPGTIQQWEWRTGERTGPALSHADVIRQLAYSPDGRLLASASRDCKIGIWDSESGIPEFQRLLHLAGVNSIRFSRDGSLLLSASDDGCVQLWNTQTGSREGEPIRLDAAARSAVFSPDEQTIATACAQGTVRVWDRRSQMPITPPLHGAPVVEWVMFSPDGTHLLSAAEEGIVQVWDLTAQVRPRVFAATEQDSQIRFTADRGHVYEARENGDLQIRNAVHLHEGGATMSHEMPRRKVIRAVAVNREGTIAFTGCTDGTVRRWGLSQGIEQMPRLQHENPVVALAIHPDEGQLLAVENDGRATLWDLQRYAKVAVLNHEGPIRKVSFNSDGNWFVTASDDGTARVWKTADGSPVSPWLNFGSRIRGVAFSPDSEQVATAGDRNSAARWHLPSGRRESPDLTHDRDLVDLLFDREGASVLTTSLDGTARLWDSRTARLLIPPLKHRFDCVFSGAISFDGRLIVTGGGRRAPIAHHVGANNGEARVWDAQTGELAAPPFMTPARVTDATFSGDASVAVTRCFDESIFVWDIRPDPRPLEELKLLASVWTGYELHPSMGLMRLDETEHCLRFQRLKNGLRPVVASISDARRP